MSPEALTAERLQHDLRQMLRNGELGLGIPLVVQSLADDFGVSITPVRDALNRLVGERLVEVHPGGGFAVPGITIERVICLYEWHADIIGSILRNAPDPDTLGPIPELIQAALADAPAIAALTDNLFKRVGLCSGNPERRLALERVGDRLHILRLHEGHLSQHGAELRTLWQVLRAGDKRSMRIAMGRYHRRRLRDAERITLTAMGSIRVQKVPTTR